MQIDKSRLGQFFLFLGLASLAIFLTTDQVNNPTYGFFLAGLILTLLGVYLMVKNRKPPPPTARFATYRKMRQKSAERKAKRQSRQAEKEKKRKR